MFIWVLECLLIRELKDPGARENVDNLGPKPFAMPLTNTPA
jgi:hypothetical protein